MYSVFPEFRAALDHYHDVLDGSRVLVTAARPGVSG